MQIVNILGCPCNIRMRSAALWTLLILKTIFEVILTLKLEDRIDVPFMAPISVMMLLLLVATVALAKSMDTAYTA